MLSPCIIITGDFNAKIGEKFEKMNSLGKFTVGQKNENGEGLIDFAERNKLKISRSFFKKKAISRYIWKLSDNKTKN